MSSDKSQPVMFTRQAAELDHALERNSCTPDFVKWLSTGDNLANIRDVYLGIAEIKVIEHVINCDADPIVPNGWRVEKHEKSGFFGWDPKAAQLYLSDSQCKGKVIEGNKLREELAGKPVLNANVLDYLLAHPHLIPEEWKQDERGRTRYIFFWGTIYRDSDGNLFVRYLCWHDGQWNWYYHWLGDGWIVRDYAALHA